MYILAWGSGLLCFVFMFVRGGSAGASSSPAAPKLSFELVKQVHALLEVAGLAKHDHGNSSSLTSSAGKADGVIEELMATGLKIMTQGCLVNVCLFRTNTFVSRCAVIHG